MTVLCRLDEIPDPGARGPFTVEHGGDRVSIFLVRMGGEVFAYVNSCPHVGAPLEMEPDRFLDSWGETIVCSMHGAGFEPATGACLRGPCRGKGLTAYPVAIRDGMVIAALPERNISLS